MKFSKLISLMLMLCLICTLALTACSDKEDTSNESNTSKEEVKLNRYDGETLTFLTCSVNSTYESEILSNTDAYKEEGLAQSLPDIVNNDLQNRKNLIEQNMGVTVEEIKFHSPKRPYGEICDTIRKDVMSSNEDYQIVVPCLYDAAALAVEDMFLNLRGINNLNIDAEWWNQSFNDSMTYAGQLYFTVGDIGIVNKNSTASLFVNLDLWEKLHLSDEFGGNPYELVRNGKWTLDTIMEASRALSKDENNDQKIDYNDSFGWAGQLDDMWSIFFGAGEKIASADSEGYPALSMYNERSARLMDKMQEFVQDDAHYISANDYFGVVQWPTQLTLEAFTTGRCIFFNGSLGTVIELGDMEERFAIVPIPKMDAKQDSYHSLVNPWTSTCFAIPVSVTGDKLKMTADVLNYMGEISKDTVAKNYQETVINYMKIRDDDSIDMVENYILPNRACDVGMVFKWGGLDGLLQEMADSTKGSFSSKYEAKEDAAQTALEDTIKYFKDKE